MFRALHASQSSQVNSHLLPEKDQGIQQKAPAKRDKMCGHEENNVLSIYIHLFQSTLDDILSNQLNAKHDNGIRFRQHGY